MQIRRLELIGFKSFVGRTRFEFPDGITAIVGPNGCGKSNIVDAMRWVLGEQSPTHLRGRAMEDVIFNGNERTGPHGMTEVSLVLERTGTGPIWDAVPEGGDEQSDLREQLAGVTEITVTRRYFRSGESAYLINRVPCRLRDITELFLGSGVGTKAYAIIEQGRVEQLVNAKPDALRLFIEEAAGTTRYRSRRNVAERKMERTRGNLTRLADIIHEIERQIGSLTRQAKRAEQYRQYRQELRDLELCVARHRHHALRAEVDEAEGLRAPLGQEEERLVTELRNAEKAVSSARDAVRAADEGQRSLQLRIVELRLEAQAAEQRLGYLDDTLRDLERRRDQAEAERQRLATDSERTTAEQAQAEDELHRLGVEAREASGRHERCARHLQDREGSLVQAEKDLEEAKGGAVQALAEEVRLQNLMGAIVRHSDDVRDRLDRAQQGRHRRAEDEERCRRDLEAARDRAKALEAEGERLDTACHEQLAVLEESRRVEATAARDLEGARERVAALRSRCSSLEELRARWEGCTRGVRSVVESSPDTVRGVIADVLQVPEAYEAAVAAALGSRLQCLIVRDHDDAVRALRVLEGSGGGRASFIPLSIRPPSSQADQGSRSLFDLVETAEEYRPLAQCLLGNVFVVDTVAEAVALWRRNGTPAVAVTRKGELIDALGVLSGGGDRPLEETLLARNREIRDLRAKIATATAAANQAAERHGQAANRVEALRRVCEELTNQLQGVHVEHAQVVKDQERLQDEHRRLAVEREAADSELRDLSQQRDAAAAESNMLSTRQETASRVRAEHEGELAERQAALAAARARVEQARGALGELAVEGARRLERRDRVEENVRTAARRADELRARLQDLVQRAQQLAADATRLRTERERLQQQHQATVASHSAADAEAAVAGERAAAAAAEATRCEDIVRQQRDKLDRCRESRREIEVALAERRAALEHLVAAVLEKHGEDLSSSGGAALAEGAPGAETEQRIDELRRRIGQLGEVHVGAIEELEELRSRNEYLSRQKQDLERSVDDLRRTIAKLNRMSRLRFRETFEAVNAKLQELFPRLFPGGRAQLVLTEGEEGAEPGVEIVVQPAGKKLQSLSLLSGGEKALSAVALILSLFMIRPTPFCVLDEVDAPLDDANVGRFDQLVREISRSSQFVLITHNKRTMEAADTLYGITMEEAGVSTVVSVRLKQAA
jgi:chromosome segregation protein